ncbi:MAG: SDR family NAD(P)-dependent oxidoreductase, partial [Salibacteraceae bacterium]
IRNCNLFQFFWLVVKMAPFLEMMKYYNFTAFNSPMKNEVCLITGCNSGIGKETALQLARQGYEVIMLVKESEKSALAFEEIIRLSRSNTVRMEYVDLSSFTSISDMLTRIKETYSEIHLLINNEGVFKRNEEYTEEGFEMNLAINYLAPFYITTQLLPILKNTPNAKVVNLGSELGKNGEVLLESSFKLNTYSNYKAYANSKLLLLYFTFEMARRVSITGITVNCVHPGFVNTQVFRDYPNWLAKLMGWFIDSPAQGAEGVLNIVNNVQGTSGKYFNKLEISNDTTNHLSFELSEKIWELTQKMLNDAL